MKFCEYKQLIEQGDTIVLYVNFNSMYAIEVNPYIKNKKEDILENVFQTSYGALKVNSLIGKKYGSKIQLSRGWAYVLHPTSELWTLTLPHRTQILYCLDVGVVVHELELGPGHFVVESGTGSGSLSHALIRAVQPEGRLYTFDFHADRARLAKEEFQKHGIADFVNVFQRDVCLEGFGKDLDNKSDAVFLDLPHPWEAIKHIPDIMKSRGGRFGSFSPCIEQVQKTCRALRDSGFVEIRTMECLQKEYQVRTKTFPVLDLDPSTSAEETERRVREQTKKITTGVPPSVMPGHTGYLTFATLPPLFCRKNKRIT